MIITFTKGNTDLLPLDKKINLEVKEIDKWLVEVYDTYNSQFQTHQFEYANDLISDEDFENEKGKYLEVYNERLAKLERLKQLNEQMKAYLELSKQARQVEEQDTQTHDILEQEEQ